MMGKRRTNQQEMVGFGPPEGVPKQEEAYGEEEPQYGVEEVEDTLQETKDEEGSDPSKNNLK